MARLLVAAENPVLVADRVARTPAGLAGWWNSRKLLQAPVIDQQRTHEFPDAPSAESDRARGARLIGTADVIAGPRADRFLGHREFRSAIRSIALSQSGDQARREADQHHGRRSLSEEQLSGFPAIPAEVDLAIAADAEATLPSLIEAVKRQITGDRKHALRGSRQEARGRPPAGPGSTRARPPTPGWDASPISTARMSAELWAQIKDEDWSLVSNCQFVSRWPLRLWDFNKHYQYIGSGRRLRRRLRRCRHRWARRWQPQARPPDRQHSE